MRLQPALHQRPHGLEHELHLGTEQIEIGELVPEVRRLVVSRDAGDGLRDWFLVCASGHDAWCSLPFLTHDAALFGTCAVCRELHEGHARFLRVGR